MSFRSWALEVSILSKWTVTCGEAVLQTGSHTQTGRSWEDVGALWLPTEYQQHTVPGQLGLQCETVPCKKNSNNQTNKSLLFCCFYTTLTKTNLEGEFILLTTHAVHQLIEAKTGTSWRQELKRQPWRKLLTGWLLTACSTCFSIQPRPTFPPFTRG